MTAVAKIPTPTSVTPSIAAKKVSSTFNGMLQRKCACGGSPGASSECEECGSKRIQRKLTIGSSNDPLELEADRVADEVMARPSNPAVTHAPVSIQRFSESVRCGDAVAPASVNQVLSSPGSPLEPTLRKDMEQRFGHDFSKVRLHIGNGATQSTKDVNAVAYTVGHHIVFAERQFNKQTTQAQRLVAHELTHVVQQSSAKPMLMRQPSDDAQVTPPVESPLSLPSEAVDMPWIGKGVSVNSSELGYLREHEFFWSEYDRLYPGRLSPSNLALVARRLAPKVDQLWVRHYPQHGGYLEDTLEHHHVGQGSQAVPLPSKLHDAYTVFHPQRRVVGSPSGGVAAVPSRPTRADAQTELDRHVRAGRIRGAGINPNAPPNTPSVPLASEAALVPRVLDSQGVAVPAAPSARAAAQQQVTARSVASPQGASNPTDGSSAKPRVGVGRAPSAAKGELHIGLGGGVGAVIAADVLSKVLVQVINHYLQKYYSKEIAEAADTTINQEVKRKTTSCKAVIAAAQKKIEEAQADGKLVSLQITLELDWQDTVDKDPFTGSGLSIGSILMKADLVDVQIVYEGTEPKHYYPPQPEGFAGNAASILGDLFNENSGRKIQYREFQLPIDGTNMVLRRIREIDAQLQSATFSLAEIERLTEERKVLAADNELFQDKRQVRLNEEIKQENVRKTAASIREKEAEEKRKQAKLDVARANAFGPARATSQPPFRPFGGPPAAGRQVGSPEGMFGPFQINGRSNVWDDSADIFEARKNELLGFAGRINQGLHNNNLERRERERFIAERDEWLFQLRNCIGLWTKDKKNEQAGNRLKTLEDWARNDGHNALLFDL
jgi:HNH/Endo VII superfamily nuclease toxin with a HHH motif/Domain of unknown function (DUF4157)